MAIQSEIERSQAAEIVRLKRQLTERDQELNNELHVHRLPFRDVSDHADVPGAGGLTQRLLSMVQTADSAFSSRSPSETPGFGRGAGIQGPQEAFRFTGPDTGPGDRYDRKTVARRMTAKLTCDALMIALWRRGIITHSDRGSQYCSKHYQAMIKKHGLLCSMGAKGNCYDNAVAESFFHTLKVEAIHGEQFATREEMRKTVFEYIEVDYNQTRRHSNNGFISPALFEAQKVA